MLRYTAYFVFAITLILLGSCKVNRFKDGLRTGLWINDNAEDGFKSRGRYKKDREKGVWKYFYNDTLYQKDKYSGNNARVRLYHRNQKVSARGKTQIEFDGKMAHWYYNGDWKYFDPEGKLVRIVTYEKGDRIAEVAATELPDKPGTNKRSN